jgi:DNA-binding transcriptional MocR family regulator
MSTDEKLDRIASLLEDILKWERIDGMGKAETLMKELMKRDVEKLVYENSDGRTSREIADASGVSHGTVVNYWNKWAKYGLVEEVKSRGGTRYRKIFSLSDFGIEIPTKKLPSQQIQSKAEQDRSSGAIQETAEQPSPESAPAEDSNKKQT